MKKKMLYIMGVDWEWIYQRPHVFAKQLAQDYDVTVLFPRSVLKIDKKLPGENSISFRILWTVPYQEKNNILGRLVRGIHNKIFKDIHSFDCIFVGYPIYARYIPADYKGKIIYDCMDNHEALYPDQKRVYKMVRAENDLIPKCDLILASANLLEKKIKQILPTVNSIVVRNGMGVSEIHSPMPVTVKKQYSIGYIGTISKWFDYPLILESLKQNKNIDYHLIGPADTKVTADRVVYHGPVAHKDLWNESQNFDCLIMPFVLNDIVTAVDPVKFYEYIAFGKCIISVFYPEIERFKDFVYFYESEQEYIELINTLKEKGFPPKYDSVKQREFLANNTWGKRYELLRKKLKEIGL